MNIAVIVIALILAFFVFKLVFGVLKFVLIAAIVIAAIGFVAKRLR